MEYVDEGIRNMNSNERFTGHEFQPQHGLNWHDMGWRPYDGTTGITPTIDRMAEDYYWISPYVYCANNPVRFIDPNGMEVLAFFDPEKDQNSILGASNFEDDGAIHVFVHGTSEAIYPFIDGKTQKIKSVQDFQNLLEKYSEDWKNRKDEEQLTIVLHSCNTGNDRGNPSFAKKISKGLGKNVKIIAPDTYHWTRGDGVTSVYNSTARDSRGRRMIGSNGKPKSDKKGEKGKWRILVGGEEVRSLNGNFYPSDNNAVNVVIDFFQNKQEKDANSFINPFIGKTPGKYIR